MLQILTDFQPDLKAKTMNDKEYIRYLPRIWTGAERGSMLSCKKRTGLFEEYKTIFRKGAEERKINKFFGKRLLVQINTTILCCKVGLLFNPSMMEKQVPGKGKEIKAR